MKNEDGRPPSERYIPIEINDSVRKLRHERGPNRPMIPMEHLLTLNELLSAYYYDGEKERLFGISRSDQLLYDITDELLDTAITEMQEEGVTVVGLMFKIIQKVLEIHPVLRKQLLGPVLHHARSSAEVRAEMECVSRSLARLQEQLGPAVASESHAESRPVDNVLRLPTAVEPKE